MARTTTKNSKRKGPRGRPTNAVRQRLLQQRGLGRLKKNINLLRVLADSRQSPKLRSAIIDNSPADLVDSVGDCCRNVLNGNVKLSPARKRQLSVHRRAIRLLAAPNVGVQKKKRTLKQQRGGFLATLLAAAVPVAVDLLIRHFRKKT